MDRELVDGNVIAGHVVPDVLLFTRPLIKTEQKTSTYTDKSSSIKVTAVIQLTDDTGKSVRRLFLLGTPPSLNKSFITGKLRVLLLQ